MAALTESTVEDATLAWLEPTGWRIGCAGLGVALYDEAARYSLRSIPPERANPYIS